MRRLNIFGEVLAIYLLLISLGCKSQNTRSISDNIKPTHETNNQYLEQIFKETFNNDAFKNWHSQKEKALIVSSEIMDGDTLVRVIPFYMNLLDKLEATNDYSAQLMYDDVFVLYWGDTKIFFNALRNKVQKDIFNTKKATTVFQKDKLGNDIIVINSKAYYGADYLIKNKEIILDEINYFSKPILTD